ncbi:hypothetical protein [Rhizobium sp. BK176]|uniref:hypothetical protein n=1 Tax=Rhizobium sp. BK176 TaxID=2587071 RepID=UPI00216A5C9C|nr:hypothetical protein [Rhizobium sp. BK176]MCS4089314.1 hypothetical protein [Rhizobium sp. BK176]
MDVKRNTSLAHHTIGSVFDLIKPYTPTLALVGGVVAILAVGLGTSSAVSSVSSRLDRQDVVQAVIDSGLVDAGISGA